MVRLEMMTPFAADMNLGKAYDEAMALLPRDAWVVFVDHDAMHTTKAWWHEIQSAIACRPDAGAFTAMTNRIASDWQQCGDRSRHDMGYHYELGEQRRKHRTLLDITETKGFGGVAIVVSKATWDELADGHGRVFADGLLCVDHSLHFKLQAAKKRVYMIESLYLYHRRRAFAGGELDESTAPKVKDCPCRGTEARPKLRIPLPALELAAV